MEQAGASGHRNTEESGEIRERLLRDDGDAPLLASMWVHGVVPTSFRGAHGHRNRSPYPIEERVRILSDTGFNAIGFIQQDLEHILQYNPNTASSTRGRLQKLNGVLRSNGIDFVELQFLTQWPLPEDDPRRQAERGDRDLLLEAADVLDANHLKIGNINAHPLSISTLRERSRTSARSSRRSTRKSD